MGSMILLNSKGPLVFVLSHCLRVISGGKFSSASFHFHFKLFMLGRVCS